MYSAIIVVAVRIIWVPIDMPGQIIAVVVGVCTFYCCDEYSLNVLSGKQIIRRVAGLFVDNSDSGVLGWWNSLAASFATDCVGCRIVSGVDSMVVSDSAVLCISIGSSPRISQRRLYWGNVAAILAIISKLGLFRPERMWVTAAGLIDNFCANCCLVSPSVSINCNNLVLIWIISTS